MCVLKFDKSSWDAVRPLKVLQFFVAGAFLCSHSVCSASVNTSECLRVAPADVYSPDSGFGWVPGSQTMCLFNLPEGNYVVRIKYKTPAEASASTVKAEARRLMLRTEAGTGSAVRSFSVNIRRAEIDGGGCVRLNSREKSESNEWDGQLSLEFLPGRAGVSEISVVPARNVITVYIAGDSTVTDQPLEPWCGWGQILPCFFDSEVAIANHAESGRALFSFLWEKRLEKILSTIQPGDYLFIQFGHNDQKDKRDGAGPFTTYTAELKEYIAKVREKDAHPVLITPMERRRWKAGKPQETLSDYAEAMRQVGRDLDVPVLDLHAMSLTFYAALGQEESKGAFVHFPANTFPGQTKALKDDTHHNVYGAYELACCVVEAIKARVPELAGHLRARAAAFDPAQPDDPADIHIPASGGGASEKPEGD